MTACHRVSGHWPLPLQRGWAALKVTLGCHHLFPCCPLATRLATQEHHAHPCPGLLQKSRTTRRAGLLWELARTTMEPTSPTVCLLPSREPGELVS